MIFSEKIFEKKVQPAAERARTNPEPARPVLETGADLVSLVITFAQPDKKLNEQILHVFPICERMDA